jgi:hypothetical protein
MRRVSLFFLMMLALALPVSARGHEVLWAGLIYASNEAKPAPVPSALSGFSDKLKEVFEYNQLKLVSERREPMEDGKERVFPLGKRFRLFTTRKSAKNGKAVFDLRLFQNDRLIVQTEAELGVQSPLFLRGPQCSKGGQLIIVLQVE